MPEEGQTWFTVMINYEKQYELFVPERISKLFRRSREDVRVYRGDSTRIYQFKWNKIRDKSGIEIYFKEGWYDFVKDNSIEAGDILDLLYMGDGAFKVLIWRDGKDITSEFIEISSDSSVETEPKDNDAEREKAELNYTRHSR
ncbi:B3 domain-containing protein At1g16640-like [Chenopodium quinoa]|uniref:B3 domain-containing protein At1g16640-like n=1 Tax=Chenopodium quinoa TaxID=63459 RepID=UPI000B783E4E|nr:B3 domain-containing protein At1g16640-like [Chenopodium quinoa]